MVVGILAINIVSILSIQMLKTFVNYVLSKCVLESSNPTE